MTAVAGTGADVGRQTPAMRIETVLGRADDLRAEVYVRLVGDAAPTRGPCAIAGTLAGPRCGLATTLPTTARLVDLGGMPPAARGILTEPSYWTPELPNLYRLVAEVRDTGTTVASAERLIGLRRLGVRGRSFWLDGRRWVPRGVGCDPAGFDATALRATMTAAVIDEPAEAMCSAADAAGVALVAVVSPSTAAASLAVRIAAWAQHPAVMLAVLDQRLAGTAEQLRDCKGTLLIGLAVDGTLPPPATVPKGIDCLIVQLPHDRLPDATWREHAPDMPLVAHQAGGPQLGAGRSECDRLQTVLAAWGCAASRETPSWDWAGYLAG